MPRRIEDFVSSSSHRTGRRGCKRTVALIIKKFAPDSSRKTEGPDVVWDKDGDAAGMDAVGKVHEAVAKYNEVRIGSGWSVGVLQTPVRRRCVKWQDVVKVGAAVGKRSGQRFYRKRSWQGAEA